VDAIARNRWTPSLGMAVAAINRYGWTSSIGIRGRHHSVRPSLSEKQVLNERGGSQDEHDNHEQQKGGKLPGPGDIGVVQRHLRDHALCRWVLPPSGVSG
jgi:hypothetical protein